jgi:hypothetical protein
MAQWNRRVGASQTCIGSFGSDTHVSLSDGRMISDLDAPTAARHPIGMPIHIAWDRAGLPAVWHDFRGPLIGLATALGLALASRFSRSGLLAAAAGGTGVVAGWYAVGGRLWITLSRPSAGDLAAVAAVALATGLLATQLGGRNRGVVLGSLLAAAVAGWWLCGAPRSQLDLLRSWPIGLGVGVAVLLYVRILATDALDPLRLALTGLTMAASFHVAMLPAVWVQLALVPAVASLALLALPAAPGLVAFPIAVDIAAAGSLAVISFGRLPHLRVGPVDVAVVAPLFALWLTPHLASRIGFVGRAAATSAGMLAALIATGGVWLAVRVVAR